MEVLIIENMVITELLNINKKTFSTESVTLFNRIYLSKIITGYI